MFGNVLSEEDKGCAGSDPARLAEMVPINLDANANAPVTQRVTDAVVAGLVGGTNPSSGHAGGAEARATITRARDAVASLAEGVFDDAVVFTSGCTEANNTVLHAARALRATLITTAVEHPSVLSPSAALQRDGVPVIRMPVGRDGVIALDVLERHLRSISGAIVLSVQTANSETGVIQPIQEIARLIAKRGDVLFHTDAAQSFGKLPLVLGDGGAHAASVSAHKLHGPMGVGGILLSDGEDRIHPLLHGGDQEGRRRAGTEALPLIAGMGAACAERAEQLDGDVGRMRMLRDRLEASIVSSVDGAAVNGVGSPRLPNTTSIRFEGRDAMEIVARLDALGILVSQGSACSSMRPTPSHVLIAMGLTEAQAFSTVRLSTSPLNTEDEIDRAIAAVERVCREVSRAV
ncbi:cysteine desulfurase family protein [Sphingomonas sp. ABOLG]|jgi:cysteine desulfurase|uniref:cysteine desulfurase family protein n=1 Tax=Sphingomonas sp. ABOLG TaxID=1985880 RepID=UPI0013DD9260|nr:cysteine desulfurase family protein [Sphingomonas sp. ABOLG]